MPDFTPPNAHPGDDMRHDGHTSVCANSHWFDLRVYGTPCGHRAVAQPVGAAALPPPAGNDVEPRPYPGERVRVTLAGVAPPVRTLDGGGHLHIEGLPAGVATVRFEAFYTAIRKEFETGTRYTPPGGG